jgi:hypothetical protein
MSLIVADLRTIHEKLAEAFRYPLWAPN